MDVKKKLELLEQFRKSPVTVMTEEPTVEVVQEWISEKIRKHKDYNEIVVIASSLLGKVVERSFLKNGTSCDTERKPTRAEKEKLKSLFEGALFTMNYHRCEDKTQTILDTAEMIGMAMLPHLNNYASVYVPLREAEAKWEKE